MKYFLMFIILVSGTSLVSCSSSDNVSTSVGVSAYYGSGWYDPWYYNNWNRGPTIVVPPPRPDRPGTRPPKPVQPIAPPHNVKPMPRPRPMPSLPSRPRPSRMR
ncbi:hypothetical protein [Echinimonas agarilytica]|uniref:Secreted protein n=1 Tax=Echinimonas agarilytica TaxID=1215918 RepID=A0AA42B8S8_9GAMM|nr:hypothetical protein [Echinimonas agarilytica]MCM2680531.1 hypothetical protein [Echinimonas agarilytica]